MRAMADPDDPKGITRRQLFRGLGAGAVASSLTVTVRKARAATGATPVVGPGKTPIELRVNGVVHKLSVEPRATLLEVLRDQLDLTGTKLVCDRGSCGASGTTSPVRISLMMAPACVPENGRTPERHS